MEVGFKYCGYYCVRDWDSPLWWRAQECYFFGVILLIPTTIMIFAYSRIILEICRVFEQRSKMAKESIRASYRKISARSTVQKGHSVGIERKASEYICASNTR